MVELPEVKVELCDGCGLCLTVCDGEALVIIDCKACIIQDGWCDQCALCELVCPTGAIGFAYEIVFKES